MGDGNPERVLGKVIPRVSSLPQLIVPHFIIGLGVGCTDVSVLSLLASFGDIWYREWCYSMIYALNQAAVCAAYSLGPAWAGVSVSHFGFPATMTTLSVVNIIYAPFTLALRPLERALTRVHAKMESRFADE
ncbi:synaptic vesicular amine transporter-like [Galendromus occidentalis]|uniref:Synaptic vesicular amine transporter-like n=1 Tax=Galendromus occidentalis TaxID=34638 RepID=A0AAJ7WH36_9ACAR|nr:synaptic vesicular amine transporter-like [Galendromus occidentalis]